MNDYNDIGYLINDLDEDLLSISYGAIREEVVNQIHDKIMYMYTLYDNSFPNRYERGISGSFGDPNMIDVDIDITKHGICIEGVNKAMGNGENRGEYLDTYIYEGIYQFSREPVPKRPVMDWVMDYLESTDVIETLIETELKKRGYDFE